MFNKKICYTGSMLDYSGYGISARANAISLYNEKYNIRARNYSFAPDVSLIPENELQILNTMFNDQEKADYNIIHLTPENYNEMTILPGAFNAGHMCWETSLLHSAWIPFCNKVDAMFVPCNFNVDILRNSGVTRPIYVYKYSYDVNKFDGVKPHPLIYQNYKDRLKFYSIFQWSERKNPEGLLRSFLSTFTSEDKVVLFLKVYSGTNTERDRELVINKFNDVKNSLNKSNFPSVVIISDLMTENLINQIHVACDVYLAPVRGEGFGMPLLDAAIAGKQIVATDWSAHVEFMDRDNHYFLPYTMRPVNKMPWIPWYLSNQMWADPDLTVMSDIMQTLYKKWKNGESLFQDSEKFSLYINRIKKEYSSEITNQSLISVLENC